MKRLPLNYSSFRRLIRDGCIYVDKTKYILKMLNEGIYYFLSRPRRFGKSLLVTTLKELFEGEKEFFNGLYIYNKWNFEKYPVILIDFNTISKENSDILKESLMLKLEEHANNYDVEIRYNVLKNSFSELINNLYAKYQKEVAVLIDEYDKAILDHIGLGEDRKKIAYANRDVLKEFFGVLKGDDVVDKLKFVFVTGVSRFTRVSIFSEWNNLNDLTFDDQYATFLGYTQEELEQYFGEHIQAFCVENNIKYEATIEQLKQWYDGYRFSLERNFRVYNPISVMSALLKGSIRNFWFSTGTPTFLVNLLKQQNYYIPKLEDTTLNLASFEAYDLDELPIEAMFYQSGYLTIKDAQGQILKLSYPNKEVRISLNEVLIKSIYQADLEVYSLGLKLGKAFELEKFDEIREILDEIFDCIEYNLYPSEKEPQKVKEKYYHSLVYLIFSLLGYDVKSEVLNSKGRLDMAIRLKDKVYVIEFKIKGSAKDCINQIKEKDYATQFKRKYEKIILCGMVFDEKEKRVGEIGFERG